LGQWRCVQTKIGSFRWYPAATVFAMTDAIVAEGLVKTYGPVRALDGIDVLAYPQQVRQKIGLSGQNAAIDEYLTGYENLEMIGRLYHIGKARARQRARELLERFEVTEAANRHPTPT